MASSYTENLGLCQWSASDAVLRRDFNSDNQKLDTMYKNMPRMVTGWYYGSGNAGPDAPNKLTFAFEPYLVVIAEDSTSSLRPGVVLVRHQEESSGFGYMDSGSHSMNLHITWDSNRVTWYNEDPTSGQTSPKLQFNESGATYRFFAIGIA